MEASTNPVLKLLEEMIEGKWSGCIINLGLIPLLILSSVLLPPIRAAGRVMDADYMTIPETGGSLLDPDSTQLTIPPEGLTGELKAKLASVPRINFLEGSAGSDLWKAAEGMPEYLIMKSPFYRLGVRGEMPDQAILTVPVPNDSEPYSTLDLYSWTGEEWQWLPSQIILDDDVIESHLSFVPRSAVVMQTRPLAPAISAAMAADVTMPPEGKDTLVEINPQGLYLDGEGDIGGSIGGLPAEDQTASYAIVPTLRNWGEDGVVRSDLIDNMLISQEIRDHHIATIVDFVIQNMYAGIDIDYRGITPDLRDEFSRFVAELADRLHENQKLLTVRVESPRQIAADHWETGVYDWQAIGQAVDGFKIPAIVDPTAYAPGGKMEALLNWAVGEVNRYKIQLIISTRSVEKTDGSMVNKPFKDALAPFSRVTVEGEKQVVLPGEQIVFSLASLRESTGINFDEATQTYWFSFRDENGQQHTVWLENATSIARKLQLVAQYNLRGVAVQNLLGEESDQQIWEVMRKFHDLVVPPVQSQFSVVWTVQSATGGQLSQETTSLADPNYVWTAPDEPGQYMVAAAISVDGRTTAGGGSVALQVAEPTPTAVAPTPTPEPTATPPPKPVEAAPAPEPTPTPEPEPQVAAASVSGLGSQFGYGLQAHLIYNDLGPIIHHTKAIGFGWVKQQIRWGDFEPSKGNIGWGEMDRIVDGLHGADLKILFSVVAPPPWAHGEYGLPHNLQDYADFVGACAARYKGKVQAYEIWNEQNLRRDPEQIVPPDRYVALLKVSYEAIKAQDPNAIVVSGAPTPAGDVAGWAIDDINYLDQLYAAGMKDYCDAVGAHPSGYNCPATADWQTVTPEEAGIGAPNFWGPFNNRHHSWCFRGTMEGYRNVMLKHGDGNKTIWATEFGWAVSSSPVTNYEYAADNTLEKQAQYLVEAYEMSKSWGWAGVMFLWNLNFAVVNPGSEQAQFAIVDSTWQPYPAFHALAAMPK
jgi:hypothetical protein